MCKMSPTTFVQEKPTQYTHHDQLFKELIHTFFNEFLAAFFPDVHSYIDFSSIHPLSEEVFTDLLEGENRRADIVIETKIKGTETLLIIHVEPQSYGQPNFYERMYHYFSLLYNKYRKSILPIAIFSYDENRMEQDQFTIEFPFFHVLTFNFLTLTLRKLDWRTYIKSDNPAAAALLSKMGYNEEEKVQVKKEFLRMMVRLKLNPAKARLINGFFEKYLILNKSEEEKLMKEIHQLDNADEILKLPNSWEERGIAKGKEEVAVEMLKAGSSIAFIAKVTHLDKEEIQNLKDQIGL